VSSGETDKGRQQSEAATKGAIPREESKWAGRLREIPEIVSSPQANAYDGVKHSVSQKDTELRGEALRRPEPQPGEG
jgi:hypothetical protein